MSVASRLPGQTRVLRVVLGLALLASGCAFAGGTLGGREKCWPEADRRLPSTWRGTLAIDSAGGRLDTPEGDIIRLLPGTLAMRVGSNGGGELARDNGDVVARAGDDVTLFGGAGSDGALVVCGLEETHSS